MAIRTLFIAGSLRIGGSEHILVQILQRIDRDALEPHLALLDCEGQFLDRVPADIPVHSIGVSRARLATLPLARLCWKVRPQVVISFAAHLNSSVIMAKPLLPPSTSIIIREGANVTLPEVASTFRRAVYRFLYRRADAVICQSEDMIGRLTKSFDLPKDLMFRIYNSVDAPAVRRASEGSCPYESGGPHLVFVGRLVWVKGADLLIRTMPDVLKTFPQATLTIVGDGPLRRDLRLLAESLALTGGVRFTGFQTNPLPFIRHADVLVIPSRSEAFSNVALESLSLGTPIVATDCPGGMREIARYTKRLRLCPMDAASLARMIQMTVSDPASSERTPEPGFLHEFSPARMIRSYEELIARTVGSCRCVPMERMEMTTR